VAADAKTAVKTLILTDDEENKPTTKEEVCTKIHDGKSKENE
jgi:hypothetical protein